MAAVPQNHLIGNDYALGDQQFSQDGQINGSANAGDTGAADAPGKDEDRKLFIGGLSWKSADKDLREHFAKYGQIDSINVKIDVNTGRSRGFAFIVFKSADSIEKVLSAGDHIIHGKKIDAKKANARHGKIFVGGLSAEMSDDDIKNHFAQYGTIVAVEMPFDKQKNQRKGFCFITYESQQIVSELLKTPKQNINGKEVDVKKATPKTDSMSNMRGMRGMRGRGRGGYGSGGFDPGYNSYGYTSYDSYGGSSYGAGFGYDSYGYSNAYAYDGFGGGYGSSYNGGWNAGASRGGRGKGTGASYGGGKQRGAGGRGGTRHTPY